MIVSGFNELVLYNLTTTYLPFLCKCTFSLAFFIIHFFFFLNGTLSSKRQVLKEDVNILNSQFETSWLLFSMETRDRHVTDQLLTN